MTGEPQALVALCTVPTPEHAERIAGELVERRLAACVNVVGGVRSIYRWKGNVERDDELLLVIKTRPSGFEPLRQALVELHPYEVPELLALPVLAGHPDYLSWLRESTSNTDG